MWAGIANMSGVSSSSFFLSKPYLTITTSAFTKKPNQAFIVSAKFRRNNNNKNYNFYDEDDGDGDVSEDKVLAAEEETFEDVSFSINPKVEEDDDKSGPSGSDILRALQRATAQKQNKKKKKQKMPTIKAKAKADTTNSTTSSISVDSNVKPIQIRSDWRSRLDELELRLQEFLHN